MEPNASLISWVLLVLHPTYLPQPITPCSIERGFGIRFKVSKNFNANTIAFSVIIQNSSGFVFITLLNSGIAEENPYSIDLGIMDDLRGYALQSPWLTFSP